MYDVAKAPLHKRLHGSARESRYSELVGQADATTLASPACERNDYIEACRPRSIPIWLSDSEY